jgi:hypothetical protein
MLWNNDPWTAYQKSLLAIAVVLGFCCLMAEMLIQLRPYLCKYAKSSKCPSNIDG